MILTHDNLVLALELGGLAVLIGAGLWTIFRRTSASRNASPPAYDMRRDGQRFASDHQ